MAYRINESAGPYHVRQLIGRGAFGEVLLGQDPRRPDRLVAIKMVPCDLTQAHAASAAKDAALAEAELLRRLQHPHIVRCMDAQFDAERSLVWLALEYMDGGSLQTVVDRERMAGRSGLEVYLVRRVLVAVGTALNYIHSQGVLHRDVKPANVLLSNGMHQIKLADFGISKILEATGNAMTVVGTPYYFSPEIVSGQAYGPASDAWALGVVLHELTTLRRPFEASNPLALARRICEELPPAMPLGTEPDILCAVAGLLEKDQLRRMRLQDLLMLSDIIKELAGQVAGEPMTVSEELPPQPDITAAPSSGLIEEVRLDSEGPAANASHLEAFPADGRATASTATTPRGAAGVSFFGGPEEKKAKKEKKDKERGGGRRWFRFRTGFRSASAAKEESASQDEADEVTMVSAFTDTPEDSDSQREDGVSAATPLSHRREEHSPDRKCLEVERLEAFNLPGRAEPVAPSLVSKAWF